VLLQLEVIEDQRDRDVGRGLVVVHEYVDLLALQIRWHSLISSAQA
jgi:hypothetical protein